ncbi:hypothetical protein LAZ67_2003294 [Cordylochernes scorpioides]|uniref:Uncharacterized protein n=1 Tax=Cordylochernes scorpioides TaxID=51811 RepID=A0ABY6K2P1_9ARAC|nr:hypothetical protein LAZ67_2003294 [Cordylochernes scorpioides]
MPSNNSALSPAADLSAPIKQTPSTPSSPAAPSPGANIPVHPQGIPTPEPLVPAPSISELPSRPTPSTTITEPTAAPAGEIQDKTSPPIQSSTTMTQILPSQEKEFEDQIKSPLRHQRLSRLDTSSYIYVISWDLWDQCYLMLDEPRCQLYRAVVVEGNTAGPKVK